MNEFIITLDLDWAPDFMIDEVASMLRANQVRTTWFVTHQSAAVDRLREEPELFELGIHPNFLPGSTHGKTPEAILAHLLDIFPMATSVRTHSLVQSSHLLQMMITRTALKLDASLFLPGMPHIQPIELHMSGRTLLRVPFFWADSHEMEKVTPTWHLTSLLDIPGLKVLDFHTIHVYLNLSNLTTYQAIKQRVSRLNELTAPVADQYLHTGEGSQTLFRESIDYLAAVGKSIRLQDIYLAWNDKRRQLPHSPR